MRSTLEMQHSHEARLAYQALLKLEKEAKGFKRGAKGDSEGDADYRPLSWPATLLNIARGLIIEAEAIIYWREKIHAEYPADETPELSEAVERDRSNLDEERQRIEAIFTRRTF